MLKHAKLFKQLLALLLISSTFVACKDDEVVEPNNNAVVNSWIYENMKDYYYWTDEIPSNVDKNQDPTAYFDKLLSASDRFSWIVPDYEELINSLSGVSKEAGYEFGLTRAESNNDVYAIVLYAKEGSPAKAAGLMRGDVITKINGSTMNMSNYQTLIGQINENHTVEFKRYNAQAQAYEVQPQVSLTAVEFAENPHYMNKVIDLGNGKKVGYYVYNFFAAGAGQGNEYDQQMEQIFANFKAQGVNEMVLDLRYNSGGSISSAKNLASFLGKGVNSSKVFYENRWNTQLQQYIEGRSDGDAILRGRFADKAANIGNDLTSGTLYVLVGSRTASASELIINGLSPYMDIVLIGEKTVGKNVGSIPIEDEKNADNDYGMLPIVLKIFNSRGESDYDTGFVPTQEADDFASPMQPLGSMDEPLLATAISMINGQAGRISADKEPKEVFVPIMTSIDQKARTNRLIIDAELPRLAPQQ